ncbi:hypothetical protein GS491_26965 [Rhodococcus hoagii]|nr:hypothetical protein [Prescottella equi]
MGANPYDNQTMTLAFPAVTLAASPPTSVDAPRGGRRHPPALVENEASGPLALAQTLFYDDVIDPRELRNTGGGTGVFRNSRGSMTSS